MTKVYLLTSPQLPGKFKAGISVDVYRRMGEIADELAQEMGRDVIINREMALPMLLPERAEKWLHRYFKPFRANVPYHAGHTEWFRTKNLWAAVLWLLVLCAFGADLTVMRVAVVVVLYHLPYPIDGAILLIVAFIVQIVLAVFLVWASWVCLVAFIEFL